jgi:hypothetical protein
VNAVNDQWIQHIVGEDGRSNYAANYDNQKKIDVFFVYFAVHEKKYFQRTYFRIVNPKYIA